MQALISRKPGSEIAGRAGVGDQRHVVPALDPLGQLAGALRLVPLVVGDQSQRLDLEPLQQQTGAAGVLAGDHVGLVQRPPHARG